MHYHKSLLLYENKHRTFTKKETDELRHIMKIFTEQVDAEMIILFGSYARGDWIEELASDRHHYKYQSDYDIYVLVRNRKIAKRVNRRK